jgi:acylphosphatase
VLAEGTPARLASLLERLRKGPRGALVTHISEEWDNAKGEYSSFEVEPTAW